VRTADGTQMVGPPGTTPGMVGDLTVLEFGVRESVEAVRSLGDQVAAVLVEPVQSRHPQHQDTEFLRQLRAATEETGATLVFDEIITGFRVAPGGAQEWSGVRADLVCYGKVLGGGLPIGVVTGERRFLDLIDGDDDRRPVFTGTFSKNPLSMAATGAVLRHLSERGPDLQRDLNERTAALAGGLNDFFATERMPIWIHWFGSLFSFAFDDGVYAPDLFFYRLALEGVYVWEGRTCFLSTAHTAADVAEIARAVRVAATEVCETGLIARRPATEPRPARDTV
jgi:iturin family lipopeptide synthetase A